ncbi:MAG TPA: ATP synthase F1 subunit delta [Bacteroidales bacterium]|nr:ATP synthase F1 subunit delta [Lentimicrobiaceae bacterium]HOH99343.1 ATP synthase F1 subunit delta [Bacteroidales bacterium]
MARYSKIATRYAQALFDFSLEQGILEAVEKDMSLIGQLIHGSRDLKLMLQNPVISKSKKISILNTLFSSQCHQSTVSFMRIITTSGREKHLEGMAGWFHELYKEHKGIKTVTLLTAAPLKDDVKKQIINKVKAASKAEIVLDEQVKPALIGGFILQYDNMQVDTSLLKHFEKLRKEFKVNRYIRAI